MPAVCAAPDNIPANVFKANSPRGLVLATPGTGVQVSSAAGDAGAGQSLAINFGNFNASYTRQTFGAPRLFTPVGNSVLDVYSYVPGTQIAAASSGCGAVFADIDQSSTTSAQFFDHAGTRLYRPFAPPLAGELSLLGAFTTSGSPAIARVRTTEGNAATGLDDDRTGARGRPLFPAVVV